MNKYNAGIATIHTNIRKILKGRKRGIQAWKVSLLYARRFGTMYSDASITARFRQMNDVVCNLSDYTYSIKENV